MTTAGGLGELARLFLKLGAISFGGPAAHFAIMEHEVVRRRSWLSRQQFLDLIGATNLIPGPNAVEMAGHIGYCRQGLLGSLVGACCFTLPAALITVACALGYQRYGTLPQVQPFLYGIKPAVLAIILTAVVHLGRGALRTWQLMLIGAGVAAASLAGSDEIVALLVGSAIGVLILWGTRRAAGPPSAATGLLAGLASSAATRTAGAASLGAAGAAAGATATATATATVPLWKLGLFFVKVGAVMYGSGYVLIAYIEGGLVGDYGFTQEQLLDAVAIGQLTPGPLISTVTFVGYLVAGLPGAAVATMAILLPSFFFVAALNPLIPRLRSSPWASRFLDAVNAASIGLMITVTITLGRATLVDWPAWLIAVPATAVALRWKVPPAYLVLAGAVAGWVLS